MQIPLCKENYEVHLISGELKSVSMYIAKKRRMFHRSYNTKRHWTDPNKGEYEDEYWGVLGEVLFRSQVKDRNLKSIFDFPPLFTTDQKSIPKWDAKVKDKSLEIKSIPPDSNGMKRIRLMIKESEFHKDDYFIPIKFWDDNSYSFCGYLTLEEVLSSPIQQLKYSKGYCFLLSEIPNQMSSLWDQWEELISK
jgi:hypothetical protein